MNLSPRCLLGSYFLCIKMLLSHGRLVKIREINETCKVQEVNKTHKSQETPKTRFNKVLSPNIISNNSDWET